MGISHRASLALGLIIFSVLLVSILLGLSFFKVFHLFDNIRQNEMPNMTSVFSLIRESERIETLTSEIVAAQNNFIRQSLMEEMVERKAVWDRLINTMKHNGSGVDLTRLSTNLNLLYEKKIQLSTLIEKQISLKDKTKQIHMRLLVISSRINQSPVSEFQKPDPLFQRFIQLENNAISLLLAAKSAKPNALARFRHQLNQIQDKAGHLLSSLYPARKKEMRPIHLEIKAFTQGPDSLFLAASQLETLRQKMDAGLVENAFITNNISLATNTMLRDVRTRMTGDMEALADSFSIYASLLWILSISCILISLVIMGYLRRSVVGRLLRLEKETLRIAGKKTVIEGRRVITEGEDEIAQLAQSINFLLEEIASREEALLNSQKVLEERVKSRTSTIKNQNMELLKEVMERRDVQQKLESSKEELRFLSTRLLESQEDERRRIAAELHDDVAPFLGSVKFGLETVITQLEKSPRQVETLLKVVDMVKSVAGKLEHIRHALRPSMIDDLGFIESMDWYCGEFGKIYDHIKVKTSILATEKNIPEPFKIVLFRIVQEALNNVAKHSGASQVSLSLVSEADTLQLIVEDNGRGFDTNAPKRRHEKIGQGFGLVSMHERVEAAGGFFSLRSRPGNGTRVKAVWEDLVIQQFSENLDLP